MSRFRQRFFPLCLYTAISLAYAWPLVNRFSTHLAGDGFDMYVFQWDNWWIIHALRTGQNPHHTQMIFYPLGADLYFHSFSWLNTGVWWLLRNFVGNVAAYNFTVWWSWPLAGVGAYLLALEVTNDRRAALIAGLVYAFYPYHFAQRNHLNLLSIQWVPFSLVFLMRAVRRGRCRDGVLSGLFFALSGLAGWHLLTLSGMLAALWLLHAWLTERSEWTRKNWQALLALVVTLAILTGPLIAPILREWFANPEGQDPYLGKEKETQTDLIAYVLPNLYHPLWGDLAAPVHRRFLRNKDHAVTLGYTPLLLVIYSVARRRKVKNRFWLIGLLCFIILALGPFPRINGTPYPWLPLPYRLVGWTPPVRSLRSPERFNILVGLCLAMAAGEAVSDLTRRLPQSLRGKTVILLGGLILLEYWAWPFPTTSPDIPPFYYRLAAEPGDFAVADLPITNDLSKLYMFYQTVHGKPTVTGHVSRPPEGAYTFIEANAFLRAMWQKQPPAGDPTKSLHALLDTNVRRLILHTDRMSADLLEATTTWIEQTSLYTPCYADSETVVYCATLP